MIREEKHQEHLLGTGCKSLLSEKTHNNKNTKQFSDPQAGKESIKETAETNKEFHWPSSTCAVVGDSIVNCIDENYRNMAMLKCFTFWVQELLI